MKRFSGCWFGPMQLRGLLRARRVEHPRERTIGWGVVQVRDGLSMSVAMGLLGLVPGVGPILALSRARDFSRFFVLTDRRLLVLRVEHRDPGSAAHPPTHDIPIGALVVAQTVEEHVFEIGVIEENTSGSAPARLGAYEVLHSDSGPPARLKDALAMLAAGGDAARLA